MTPEALEPVAALLREARRIYADDAVAVTEIAEYEQRLGEPLRVAVAGMVKAGKSTLLNAIIGEEIAPTDTGECTRVVTWYRYAGTPRVTMHLLNGESRPLPVRRSGGRLALALDGVGADEIDRLVVEWPSKRLQDVTLIDTPGIASLSQDVSARSHGFLTPEDAPSEADAIIYLMRHMHAADLRFLESFRDAAVGQSGTVNAIAVLSRADEIGAGRIDSLISARNVAQRYRTDHTLRKLALGVVPIAGLLAQSARTLREAEFEALGELARLDRDSREAMLVSADRFARASEQLRSDPAQRRALLDRFGLFGIRLAAVLLRSGVADSTDLAHELARRSGLGELQRLIDGQFQARAEDLKLRTALVGVESLLRRRPRTDAGPLAATLEQIQASAHQFRELRLLALARTEGLGLARDRLDEAERLLGGDGISAAHRLGLAEDAGPAELREEATAALRRWRSLAESPLTDRSVAEVCGVVVRSCEGVLAAIGSQAGEAKRPRLVLTPEPGRSPREHARDEGEAG